MDTSQVIFEDHKSVMKNSPVIFHRSMLCKSDKAQYINWHENIELIRVKSGTGAVLCGDKFIQAKENDMIVINENVAHSFIGLDVMEYDCLIIDRNYVLQNGLDTSQITFDEHIPCCAPLNELFDSFANMFTKETELIDISATVFPLLNYLYKKHSQRKIYSDEGEIIKSAITYMLNNIQKNLTLDEIAENIGLSKYYFLRKFRSITGYTPLRYLNIQRCELAKILLKNDITIKQVAAQTGFDNPSYFSKVFRSITGILPTEYKKG